MNKRPPFGNRNQDSPTKTMLLTEGSKMDFNAVVQLLQQLDEGSISVGEGYDPKKESVRFTGSLSLEFPANDIKDITLEETVGRKRLGAKKGPVQIILNFFSLGGTFGPMPLSYTQFVLQRRSKKDRASESFFNSLLHRLTSLLYRAFQHHQLASAKPLSEKEKVSQYLLALTGQGTPKQKNRMGISDEMFVAFAGILSQQSRSGWGLEMLLSKLFSLEARILEVKGEWHPIDYFKYTCIGTHEKYNRLGENFVLGRKVWVDQCRIVIRFRKISHQQYLNFLPTGKDFIALKKVVRFYLGPDLEFDLVLQLETSESYPCTLGQKEGSRLGWDFCLQSPNQSTKTTLTTSLNSSRTE